jgi:Invasion associated locus B (IalB) protein
MMFFRFSLVVGALALLGSAASAVEPTSIGTFKDWEAFTYRAKDSRVCYVFSAPKKTEATKKVRRDPIFFMITHMPGRKVKGQISTIIGYPFKENSKVELTLDERNFELYTEGDMAWAGSPETDADILKALKSSGSLTIRGTSSRGTVTTDSYSLEGISAAMDKIDATCK